MDVLSGTSLCDKNTVIGLPALKLCTISLPTQGAFHRKHFRIKNSIGMQRQGPKFIFLVNFFLKLIEATVEQNNEKCPLVHLASKQLFRLSSVM